jgi:hypothetical protein
MRHEGDVAMSATNTGLDAIVSEDKLYGTDRRLTERSCALLAQAKEYFVGHTGAAA